MKSQKGGSMPLYVYQAKSQEQCCEHCAAEFEVHHSIQEKPLAACPSCGAPIERVIQQVGFHMGTKAMLSEKNLKKKGFAKLVNEGGGKFRKV